MAKILHLLILAIGDLLQQALMYINVRNQNLASKKIYLFNISFRGGIYSKCKLGYKGRMCNECDRDASNGKIYGRSGAFTCQVCPDLGI